MMIVTVSLVNIRRKKMSKIVANKYVPTYQEDYYKLPWYERDMMSYIDYVSIRLCVMTLISILMMLK